MLSILGFILRTYNNNVNGTAGQAAVASAASESLPKERAIEAAMVPLQDPPSTFNYHQVPMISR